MNLALPKPARAPRPTRCYIRRRATIASKRTAVKAAGGVDPDTWQAIVDFYDGWCAYGAAHEDCRYEVRDHVVPLSRGGTDTADNVVPSCNAHNYRKGTQTWDVPVPHPFMRREG